MALPTDAVIIVHEGSQTDLEGASGSAAVADGAVSVAGVTGLKTWTNTEQAPEATFVFQGDFASAPAAGTNVVLLCQKLATQSTNDDEVPTANHPVTFIGLFQITDTAAAQQITITAALPDWKATSIYQFYILNETLISLDAGWKVFADGRSVGPNP